MIRTVAVRLSAFAVTLLAASILLFVAVNVLPGSAARSALGIDATPEAIARFEAQHGLDRPWTEQYLRWVSLALEGDFGKSFQNGVAIGPDLATRIPVTLELAILAFLFANIVAIPIGIAGTSRRNAAADGSVTLFATIVSSIPSFWLATLLVMLFTLQLHWLPPGGFTPLLTDPARNLQQMIMPAISLGLVSSGLLIRVMRTAMLEVQSSDYIRMARAKGGSPGFIMRRHALRNAAIPYLHVATVEFGFLVGGVVVIEDIFRLPGLGSLVLVGVINRDFPVLMAGALTITLFVLISNLLVDLVSDYVDPRRMHSVSA
jgi:peptide/nickel transport system permease protein